MFNIIEKFVSIDGEGPSSGELAVFIRFQGCNLRCSWCDTKYSWPENEIQEQADAQEIYSYIKKTGIKDVTLTGGEPLIQKDIDKLLVILNEDKTLCIHIETNGAVDISPFKKKYTSGNISYILDFKLPSSGMTDKMNADNLLNADKNDVYKFVIADKKDLETAYNLITKNNLQDKCKVFLSPVSGKIKYDEIVEFMKLRKMNNVRFQLQLHKIIWDKNLRGV